MAKRLNYFENLEVNPDDPIEMKCSFCQNALAIFACQCSDPLTPLCLTCFGAHFAANPQIPHITAPLDQVMMSPREAGDVLKRNRTKMYLTSHLTQCIKEAEEVVENRTQELEAKRDATIAAINDKTDQVVNGLKSQLATMKEFQQQLCHEIDTEDPTKDQNTDGQRLLDSIPMDDYRNFTCEAIKITTNFKSDDYSEAIKNIPEDSIELNLRQPGYHYAVSLQNGTKAITLYSLATQVTKRMMLEHLPYAWVQPVWVWISKTEVFICAIHQDSDASYILNIEEAQEEKALVPKANMTVPRTGPAIVKYANKILVFGGHQGTPPGIPDSEAFSLGSETWDVIAPLPEPSHCNNAVSFDDMIYITGKEMVDVLRYNPETMNYCPLGISLRKSANSIFIADGLLYILNKDEQGGSYDIKGNKISTGLAMLPGTGIQGSPLLQEERVYFYCQNTGDNLYYLDVKLQQIVTIPHAFS